MELTSLTSAVRYRLKHSSKDTALYCPTTFRLYDQNSTTGLHADSSMSTGQAEAPKQRPLRALYVTSATNMQEQG